MLLSCTFLHKQYTRTHKKLATFPSDCWAHPWASKFWCKHYFLSADRENKGVQLDEEQDNRADGGREGGGVGGGGGGGGEEAKKRGCEGESCAKTQLVWLGCLSESKMGGRDWEKDERLWEGTVEEEEAYNSEAESRSATNGNTRWLICLSQWQKLEIWVREIWYRT